MLPTYFTVLPTYFTFLSENNFEPTPLDPTNKYQTNITRTIKQCNIIFHKNQYTPLTQKNPTPPTLKAQLKIHKPGIPIRPVVNNRTAPSYKTSKKLNNILNRHLNLKNLYTSRKLHKTSQRPHKSYTQRQLPTHHIRHKRLIRQHPDSRSPPDY